MEAGEVDKIQEQLTERRGRLERAISESEENSQFVSLLQEVDTALDQINGGSYGICEACHEPIEDDRLSVNPLIRLCLDHLTSYQQRELEEDLSLASRIQGALLPKNLPGLCIQGTRLLKAVLFLKRSDGLSGSWTHDTIRFPRGESYRQQNRLCVVQILLSRWLPSLCKG